MTCVPHFFPLLADAATQHVVEEAASLWGKLSDAVQGNLFTELIVISFAVMAFLAYYIKEKYEALQAGKETVVAYRVALHQRKERTMRSFTDGIPTNLSIIYEIFTKRSYLRRMARVKPEDREPYLDGRTYKQISLAYERDMRLWLLKVQHFTSICTLVQARFDDKAIQSGAERIRELFEMLIDLTPALPVIADVSERLTNLLEECPELAGSKDDVAAVRRSVLEQLDTGGQDTAGGRFDRALSMRLARVLALGIDRLFVRCTKQMAGELRHEPVKGLADVEPSGKAGKRQPEKPVQTGGPPSK